MTNKYLLSFTVIMAAVIGFDSLSDSHRLHSNTQGAPSANACTSCHGGSAINSGTGSVGITINGNPSGYVPGQTYQLEVTVANAGRSKFGFAISADNGSGSPRGSFSNAGNGAVQVVNSYVTHTSAGVSGSGSKTWSFNWTAPSAAQGTVRFLAYGNATNSSNSDNGDLIYSATTSLAPATTGVAENNPLGSVEVFPNPVINGKINLSLDLKQNGALNVNLLNRSGQSVQAFVYKYVEAGHQLFNLQISESLTSGLYYLVMEQNGQQSVKTVFIQQ